MNNLRISAKTPLLLLALLVLVLNAGVGVAQPGPDFPVPPEKREKIETLKVAYITKELDLTKEEAQAFWPVYNEYRNKLEALRQEKFKNEGFKRNNLDEMSDEEIEKMVDNEAAFMQNEMNLRIQYLDEFKKVLHIVKVAKLYIAERDFKKMLLDRLQGNNPGGRPPHPPQGPR